MQAAARPRRSAARLRPSGTPAASSASKSARLPAGPWHQFHVYSSMSGLCGIRRGTARPPSSSEAGSASVTRCSAPRRAASTRSGRARATPARASAPAIPASPCDQFGISTGRPSSSLSGGTSRRGTNSQFRPAGVSSASASSRSAAYVASSAPRADPASIAVSAAEEDRRGAERRVVAVGPAVRCELEQPVDAGIDTRLAQQDQALEMTDQPVEVGDVGGGRGHCPEPRRRSRPPGRTPRRSRPGSRRPRPARATSPPMPLCIPSRSHAGSVVGRRQRDPRPALVVPDLVEHPSPRRLGELEVARMRHARPSTSSPRRSHSDERVLRACSRPAPSPAGRACGGPTTGPGRRRGGRRRGSWP